MDLKEKYKLQLKVLRSMSNQNGFEYPEKYEDNIVNILENIRNMDFKDHRVKITTLNSMLLFLNLSTKMSFEQYIMFIKLFTDYADDSYPTVFQGHARDEYTRHYDMWQRPLDFYKSLNLEGDNNEIRTD